MWTGSYARLQSPDVGPTRSLCAWGHPSRPTFLAEKGRLLVPSSTVNPPAPPACQAVVLLQSHYQLPARGRAEPACM